MKKYTSAFLCAVQYPNLFHFDLNFTCNMRTLNKHKIWTDNPV